MLEQIDSEEGSNSWIVTFADMMTLILVFFILLYTLADYENKAFRARIADVNVLDGDGMQMSVIDYASRQGRNPEPLRAVEDVLGLNPSPKVIQNLRPKVFNDINSMVKYTDLSKSVTLDAVGKQINLSIDGRLLFDSGEATLKDGAITIFGNLVQIFRDNPRYTIAIRGHTDDLSISTEQFPSNWELSAIRATTVLRFFIQQGISPQRMSATGYADFIPLVANSTNENRAINRRVEFVLEKKEG